MLPMHLSVPEMAYEADRPRHRSWETPLVVVVSVVETWLAPVPLEADSTAVVAVVEVAAAVVVIVVAAAAVAFDSGVIGDPNRSAVSWDTLVEGFGLS